MGAGWNWWGILLGEFDAMRWPCMDMHWDLSSTSVCVVLYASLRSCGGDTAWVGSREQGL